MQFNFLQTFAYNHIKIRLYYYNIIIPSQLSNIVAYLFMKKYHILVKVPDNFDIIVI